MRVLLVLPVMLVMLVLLVMWVMLVMLVMPVQPTFPLTVPPTTCACTITPSKLPDEPLTSSTGGPHTQAASDSGGRSPRPMLPTVQCLSGSFHFMLAFHFHRPQAGAGWAASASCWHSTSTTPELPAGTPSSSSALAEAL